MSIYEAWNSQRPIFSRLPGVNGRYSDNAIADYFTVYWDEFVVSLKNTIDDIPQTQLNPATADEQWLNFLAPLFGWDKKYWDVNYPIEGKRKLLSNSYIGLGIWENKGSQEILTFVLDCVGVKNRVLVAGNFIVGTSTVGDDIGDNPWEFTVVMPTAYESTDLEKLCRKVTKLFSPAWCQRNFIFNDEPFVITEVLVTETGEAIATDTNLGIDVT